MKTYLRLLLIISSMTGMLTTGRAADLSQNDKQFLSAYEQTRAALASDDLAGARKAAASFQDGAEIAKSQSLQQARAAFGKVSEKAVRLAKGKHGYYVLHCEMAGKDWVQTTAKVSNPYLGKEMLGCGEIKK